eukprot:s172_g5.t1
MQAIGRRPPSAPPRERLASRILCVGTRRTLTTTDSAQTGICRKNRSRMRDMLQQSLFLCWTLLSWLSPPLHTSPTAEDISKWPVCLPFDALFDGRCLRGEPLPDTAYAMRHSLDLLAPAAWNCKGSLHGRDSPASSETTGSLNQAGSLSSASPSQGQEEGESASEDSQLPHICGFALKPVRLYTLCTAAVWLALAGSAILQKQANVIAVVYLLLLFSGLSGGTAETKPATLKSVRVFNMLVMVVWALYQCPSLPCPFLMQIDDAGPTGFLSPWQCLALEHTPQLASIGAGRERVTSVVLQSDPLLSPGAHPTAPLSPGRAHRSMPGFDTPASTGRGIAPNPVQPYSEVLKQQTVVSESLKDSSWCGTTARSFVEVFCVVFVGSSRSD